MKVLLIEPPFDRFIGQRCEWYPIGLTSIATILEKHGFEARVYNAEHDSTLPYIDIKKYYKNYNKYNEGFNDNDHPIWKEIARNIKTFKPDIVGISVKTVKVPSALKIAKICKEINERIKVVAGGFHATISPQDLLHSNEVDFVVRDEGEETFKELAGCIKRGSTRFSEISGISFKGKNGNLLNNPPRPLIKDLDILPYPKRELLMDNETYSQDQLGWIITTRGCPYDCHFCNSKAIWNRTVRFRGLRNVISEIDYLKGKYGVSNLNVIDDSFTVNKKRIFEFCKALVQEQKRISWSCITRADLIDDEMIKIMKMAGCTKIDIGIESGNERIQNLIGKGITLDQVREAARILKRNRMFWTGFFMMGFPTETKEDILETLKFMKELSPNWVCLSIFTPYPGTKLYAIAKEKGLFPDNGIFNFSHQNPKNCFSDSFSHDEFKKLTEMMIAQFDRHNKSFGSLFRRALTRAYYRNTRLIFADIRKTLSWFLN